LGKGLKEIMEPGGQSP